MPFLPRLLPKATPRSCSTLIDFIDSKSFDRISNSIHPTKPSLWPHHTQPTFHLITRKLALRSARGIERANPAYAPGSTFAFYIYLI